MKIVISNHVVTLLLVTSMIKASQAATGAPGSDRDSHGCIGTAGYTWCPALNQCIRSWETNCPATSTGAPGSDKDAHGCVGSAGYTWCPSLNQCIRSWETNCGQKQNSGAQLTAPGSTTDENGCNPTAGYEWCPSLNECIRSWETDCPTSAPGSDRNEHGCIGSAGYEWCASLNECISSWETECPTIMPGSDRDEHGCIGSAGYEWCASLNQCIRSWETNCEDQSASGEAQPMLDPLDGADVDEHGCIGSAGQTWCPELEACILPWTEDCPVVNATTYEGPDQITCDSNMRCNVNDECLFDMGNYTIGGPYMEGINGTLTLPDGCQANCTGCDIIVWVSDEHGCSASAGTTWCESKKTCIRSWEEDCPLANAETFQGPISLECDDGDCNVNDDCIMEMGSFTIGGPYVAGLAGSIDLPKGCTAQCTKCHQKNRRGLRGSSQSISGKIHSWFA